MGVILHEGLVECSIRVSAVSGAATVTHIRCCQPGVVPVKTAVGVRQRAEPVTCASLGQAELYAVVVSCCLWICRAGRTFKRWQRGIDAFAWIHDVELLSVRGDDASILNGAIKTLT